MRRIGALALAVPEPHIGQRGLELYELDALGGGFQWRSPSLRSDGAGHSASDHAGIDDGSYLPAQRIGDAVELTLAVAVLHDLAPAAESAPLRRSWAPPAIGFG